MSDNKTKPTTVKVSEFLKTVEKKQQDDAKQIIAIMQSITNLKPVMWGPSIIGFGSRHYVYKSGREGDTPLLAFSPRKSAITFYFNEGFDRYGDLLKILGKCKTSTACLYINKLDDINTDTLIKMLKTSFKLSETSNKSPKTVDEYIKNIPKPATGHFNEIRALIKKLIPDAQEVLSYGVLGYKTDEKRAKVFIAGWKDHIGLYPLPKDKSLQNNIKPYIKGKGTLWFMLDKPLPKELIAKVVADLVN